MVRSEQSGHSQACNRPEGHAGRSWGSYRDRNRKSATHRSDRRPLRRGGFGARYVVGRSDLAPAPARLSVGLAFPGSVPGGWAQGNLHSWFPKTSPDLHCIGTASIIPWYPTAQDTRTGILLFEHAERQHDPLYPGPARLKWPVHRPRASRAAGVGPRVRLCTRRPRLSAAVRKDKDKDKDICIAHSHDTHGSPPAGHPPRPSQPTHDDSAPHTGTLDIALELLRGHSRTTADQTT